VTRAARRTGLGLDTGLVQLVSANGASVCGTHESPASATGPGAARRVAGDRRQICVLVSLARAAGRTSADVPRPERHRVPVWSEGLALRRELRREAEPHDLPEAQRRKAHMRGGERRTISSRRSGAPPCCPCRRPSPHRRPWLMDRSCAWGRAGAVRHGRRGGWPQGRRGDGRRPSLHRPPPLFLRAGRRCARVSERPRRPTRTRRSAAGGACRGCKSLTLLMGRRGCTGGGGGRRVRR
jgi:hypothetical protein